jgi:inositol-phosphate phosphatase / L-galactose 1-phosphate phosphatase / histidinol-phosphatase
MTAAADTRSLDSIAEFAQELADAAGAVVRRYFRRSLAVTDKSDASPVTIADREAEAVMRKMIETRFPEHGIFGEEHGTVRAEAEHLWVLDPIDGTKSFISGVPLFGTLIALLRHGRPILGIIDHPALGERWTGIAGRPTMSRVGVQGGQGGLPMQPGRSRPCADIRTATLFSTGPDLFTGSDAAAFRRLQDKVKLTRFGTDCYAYGLVAGGHVDLVVEASLKPYDYCALIPVIEGAGGVITDWQGRALGAGSDGRVVACGDPRLHREACRILNEGDLAA